jgi:hypothetical protein
MNLKIRMREVQGLEIEMEGDGEWQAELLRQMDLAREQARQEVMKGEQE